MSNYHRLYINGGTYFFTQVTHERKPLLCAEQSLTRLRAAFRHTMKKHLFNIEAIVILPDHFHCILTLPEQDRDFSIRMKSIKHYFSVGMLTVPNHRREKNIWQKRFWEHCVRDEEDLQRCLDYVYCNPVKHGYVDNPADWSFSSFNRDVVKGIYERGWGSSTPPKRIRDLDWE